MTASKQGHIWYYPDRTRFSYPLDKHMPMRPYIMDDFGNAVRVSMFTVYDWTLLENYGFTVAKEVA